MVALGVIKVIISSVFLVFLVFYAKSEKIWTKVVQLVTESTLMVINLFQIPMLIKMQESYTVNFIFVIVWFIFALITAAEIAYKVGKNKK